MNTLKDVRIANEQKKLANRRVELLDDFRSDEGWADLTSILDGTESSRTVILAKVETWLDDWCKLGSPWRWTNHGSGIYNDAIRYADRCFENGLLK